MKNITFKIIFILFLVFLLFVFCYLIPNQGRIKGFQEMQARISNLEDWNLKVSEYLKVNNQLPKSLYDLTSSIEDNRLSFFINDNGCGNINEMLINREVFDKYVDYKLIIRTQDSWFIIEKRTGDLYHYILAIDQDGEVFKLKRI